MGKLPASANFKLDMPGVRRGKARPEEETQPAPKPARTSLPEGGKSVTFYPSKEAWLQLRMLAGRLNRPAQDLMLDALDGLFREHDLPAISRLPKSEAA